MENPLYRFRMMNRGGNSTRVLHLFLLVAIAWLALAMDAACGLPLNPGWLGHRTCLIHENADTLSTPPGGWGAWGRLRIEKNGLELLAGQDFSRNQDSLLVLANPLSPTDTLCVWTFSSRFFSTEPWVLYSKNSLPTWDSLMRHDFQKGIEPGTSNIDSHRPFRFSEASVSDKYRLDFSGSKTMAVTVGDGGGLGLDATLLLDVKGQLAENVFVEGRLSDQNVPITPEGNTATLKELDTKFIRLYGDQYDATLGDFELRQGRAGVDAVNARVSGIRGSYTRSRFQVNAALAQTQGVFRSDTLRGVDGKQQGYYLRGKDGRIFIRVLPGTETLWRNGIQLNRGVDYTIDYSEGRIDFLNRIAVSSENLFAMEFEYAEEDYPRNLVGLAALDTLGLWNFGLRAIYKSDDDKNPLGAAADSLVRDQLAQAGDRSVTADNSLQVVQPPEMRSVEVLEVGYVKDSLRSVQAYLAMSQNDANLYSELDDGNNQGWASHAIAKQSFGSIWNQNGFGKSEVQWFHDYKSENYQAFNPWIEPRSFLELWNLDAQTGLRGFSANRGLWIYRPISDYQLQGEWGFAEGSVYPDSVFEPIAKSQSQRLAIGAEWGNVLTGDAGTKLSSEAKFAQSPRQRDNYRQQFEAVYSLGSVKPIFKMDRNEWIQELSSGSLTQSEQWHPSGSLFWQTPWEPLNLETGAEWIAWRSLYDGMLSTLSDSAQLLNVDEKIRLGSVGPFSADAFYRFQRHAVWVMDDQNRRASTSQSDDFHLFEGNAHWNQFRKGFTANTGYRVQRTAEQSLINHYEPVERGSGQYIFDSLLNTYHEVETGGDFVLLGLRRDTSLNIQPYQDLQWSADFEIIPAHFPFTVKGILADIEISAQVTADLQDSGSQPTFFPALSEAALRHVRSGHFRWQPQLRWNHPDGNKHWVFQVLKEYSKTAGFYAGLENRLDFEATGRHRYAEIWEAMLTGHVENHERMGQGQSSGLSSQESQSLECRLQRDFAHGFLSSVGVLWQHAQGQAISGEFDLQGWRPGIRIEKAFVGRGRAYSTYDIQNWSGNGAGDYYALGGYSKGWTHRLESAADFELQTYLFLHLNYLLRFEPVLPEPSQRFNAEIRAVF